MNPTAARAGGLNPTPAPFIDQALPCPVCGRTEAHRDIRAQAYVEEAWDSDHRVSRYRWLNPAFAGIHPPLYAVWHCPACLYTDLKEAFQRPPGRPDRFVRLRMVFLRRLRDQDPALFLLGSVLATKDRTFETALAAHHLAIYIQEMPPEGEQDQHKLARLYLRTAWLYREGPPPLERGPLGQVETLRNLARLEGALRVLAEFAGGSPEEAGPLATLRAEVQSLLLRTRALVSNLGEEVLPGKAPGAGPGDPEPLLARAAELWPATPRAERDCLLKAVTAYQRYYEGSEGPQGSALGILGLVVDLYRRLGAWDQVLRGATELARRASEGRKELQQALFAKKDVTETERRRTRAKIESLADLMDRAKALYDEAERMVAGDAPGRPPADRSS